MSPRKTPPPRQKDESFLDYMSFRATRWVGSPASLVVHTILFILSFLTYFLGADINKILLVLTTIISMEAIYISILIQLTVNRHTKQLREVSKDVEDIQENVEDIQEDVEEIQEDIDEIAEDVEDIQEDVEEIQEDEEIEEKAEDAKEKEVLERIEHSLKELGHEIAEMKRRGHTPPNNRSILGE
ncbi:MAG: DUF1003 domain-containing protein [Candidatus Pacebacteria bacterium]|nr:DUF1003 domain-containing protein [Candidatus Paceibacterota bacterium]